MPYFERKTTSGKLVEVERYFATRDGKRLPRAGNESESTEEQQKLNERHAQKRLMRLINANFDGEAGDQFVTFTHAEDISEKQARKEARNLIDRLDRLRKKKKLSPLKYIIVTEHQGRWHHHVILNGGLSLAELGNVWNRHRKRGRFLVSTLDDLYTYEDLAKYLTENHKPPKGRKGPVQSAARGENSSGKEPRRKYARRWNASRNLKQPAVQKKPIKRPPSAREPKPPKGCTLLPNWYTACDRFGNLYQYFAYIQRPKKNNRRNENAVSKDRT